MSEVWRVVRGEAVGPIGGNAGLALTMALVGLFVWPVAIPAFVVAGHVLRDNPTSGLALSARFLSAFTLCAAPFLLLALAWRLLG
jgi:hypothetical protein